MFVFYFAIHFTFYRLSQLPVRYNFAVRKCSANDVWQSDLWRDKWKIFYMVFQKYICFLFLLYLIYCESYLICTLNLPYIKTWLIFDELPLKYIEIALFEKMSFIKNVPLYVMKIFLFCFKSNLWLKNENYS